MNNSYSISNSSNGSNSSNINPYYRSNNDPQYRNDYNYYNKGDLNNHSDGQVYGGHIYDRDRGQPNPSNRGHGYDDHSTTRLLLPHRSTDIMMGGYRGVDGNRDRKAPNVVVVAEKKAPHVVQILTTSDNDFNVSQCSTKSREFMKTNIKLTSKTDEELKNHCKMSISTWSDGGKPNPVGLLRNMLRNIGGTLVETYDEIPQKQQDNKHKMWKCKVYVETLPYGSISCTSIPMSNKRDSFHDAASKLLDGMGQLE